ncbi:MAG: phosphohydrolase [Candidatus Omnitrophica bacterium]|nr:phosphohydrolase [Candidatus Omnitrophota bacterium]
MIFKCPGQDERNLKSEIIPCPGCGYGVEIFSDEIKVKCPACRGAVLRQRLPTCVDWCKSGRDCVGEERYKQFKTG